MFAVLTIGWGVPAISFAQAPDDPPPIVLQPVPAPLRSEEDGFALQLAKAKVSYFSGDVFEAARAFQDLWDRMREGEDPGPEDRREALTYLAEIRYRQNALEVAEAVLRWLLDRDPEATMSPFHHPMEVVKFFETVRDKVALEQQQKLLTPQLPPPSVWSFMPLGIPQAHQGRTGAAVAYGGLQVALAATSIGLWVHLKRLDQPDNVPAGWSRAKLERQIALRTYGVNWPVSALFYATWGLSARDALRHRRPNGHPPDLTMVPLGPRGTTGLTFTATVPSRPRRRGR